MTVPPLALTVAKALLGPVAKRLPDLLLGSRTERELAKAVEQGLGRAVGQLGMSEGQLEFLALILTETFSRAPKAVTTDIWTPSDGSLVVLIQDHISGRLALLDDAALTGVGTSSFALLDLDAEGLGDSIAREILNAIVQHCIRPDSPLYLLAGIVRDELQHNELLAAVSGLRTKLDALLPSADHVVESGVVSLVERVLVVPDGTNAVVIHLAVTNTSRAHQRLRRLMISVTESRPSAVIRLRQAGAPLQEYDLAVDLRGISAVDTLKDASHQFVLRPGDSEAFRIVTTVSEGTRYMLMIQPEFESITGREFSAGRGDHVTVDYPMQSVEALRKGGLF